MKAILPIIFCATLTGCDTLSQTGTLVGTTGAGAAVGYVASKGNPVWTGVGAAGGLGAGAAINAYNKSSKKKEYQEGYDKGQADSIKQHYWMLQSQQERTENDAVGAQKYYSVTVPAHKDDDGVLRTARNITIPVVE